MDDLDTPIIDSEIDRAHVRIAEMSPVRAIAVGTLDTHARSV